MLCSLFEDIDEFKLIFRVIIRNYIDISTAIKNFRY